MAVVEEEEIDNKCMRWVVVCARWGLVVVIGTIILCAYYLYVVVLCLLTITNMAEKVFFLVVIHVIIFLLVWSYIKAVSTRIATTPDEFYLPSEVRRRLKRAKTSEEQNDILYEFARDLPVNCTTKSGEIRYCQICRAVKPDRAHHCSVCKRCVLKMDHHCPWTNNCVCFSNYKFFHLALLYAIFYTSFMAISMIGEFKKVWNTYDVRRSNLHSFEIVTLFYGSISFATVLLGLYVFHLVLVMLNLTTLDLYQHSIFRHGRKKNQFDVGCCKNFRSVFGEKWWLWFIPIYTSQGDGVTFPLRDLEEEEESQRLLEKQTEESAMGTKPNEI